MEFGERRWFLDTEPFFLQVTEEPFHGERNLLSGELLNHTRFANCGIENAGGP